MKIKYTLKDKILIANATHNKSSTATQEDLNNFSKADSPRYKKLSRIQRLHKRLDEVKNDTLDLKKANAKILFYKL